MSSAIKSHLSMLPQFGLIHCRHFTAAPSLGSMELTGACLCLAELGLLWWMAMGEPHPGSTCNLTISSSRYFCFSSKGPDRGITNNSIYSWVDALPLSLTGRASRLFERKDRPKLTSGSGLISFSLLKTAAILTLNSVFSRKGEEVAGGSAFPKAVFL